MFSNPDILINALIDSIVFGVEAGHCANEIIEELNKLAAK
jgi:hypothetical protein